jgi:hypothetical protein
LLERAETVASLHILKSRTDENKAQIPGKEGPSRKQPAQKLIDVAIYCSAARANGKASAAEDFRRKPNSPVQIDLRTLF